MSRDISNIPNPLSEEVHAYSAATTSPGHNRRVNPSINELQRDQREMVSYLVIERGVVPLEPG